MPRKLSKTFEQVEEQAKFIDEARERCLKTKSECLFAIGQQLWSANEKLARYGEGTFIKWCKDRLELKKTTAYKWMRVADCYRDCPQCVQSIAPNALYLLSAPSTPRKARVQANKIVEQGGFVSVPQAKAIIADGRDYQRPAGNGNGIDSLALMKLCWKELGKHWHEASDDARRQFNEWRTHAKAARWRDNGGVRYRPAGMTRERMLEIAAEDDEEATRSPEYEAAAV